MTRSIQERVTKCEEEIKAIKTRQKTQADSYTFYKYRTNDLYTSSARTVEVVFHPLKADTSQVVCNFQRCDLRGNIGFEFVVSATDPLRATLSFPSQSESYNQSWQRHVYITCTSNVEGYLQTIIY